MLYPLKSSRLTPCSCSGPHCLYTGTGANLTSVKGWTPVGACGWTGVGGWVRVDVGLGGQTDVGGFGWMWVDVGGCGGIDGRLGG